MDGRAQSRSQGFRGILQPAGGFGNRFGARLRARRRDNYGCVVTRGLPVHAPLHVPPSHLGGPQPRRIVWASRLQRNSPSRKQASPVEESSRVYYTLTFSPRIRAQSVRRSKSGTASSASRTSGGLVARRREHSLTLSNARRPPNFINSPCALKTQAVPRHAHHTLSLAQAFPVQ